MISVHSELHGFGNVRIWRLQNWGFHDESYSEFHDYEGHTIRIWGWQNRRCHHFSTFRTAWIWKCEDLKIAELKISRFHYFIIFKFSWFRRTQLVFEDGKIEDIMISVYSKLHGFGNVRIWRLQNWGFHDLTIFKFSWFQRTHN
jgi:hypothetical protein